MQKIAIILVLVVSVALLLFLVYFSFKLLRDTQKQMQAEKNQHKSAQSKIGLEDHSNTKK